MALSDSIRKKIYEGEIGRMLLQFFESEITKFSVNVGGYTHTKEADGKVALADLGPQGYHGLRIIKGELRTNGDVYVFYVKCADVGDAEGATHIQRNSLYLVEAEKFNVPTTPLSCSGLFAGKTYVLTESAGEPLHVLLAEKGRPSELTMLAAVANNVFGVSRKTLEDKLGQVPGNAVIYDSGIVRPSGNDVKANFYNLFDKGINRLINQAIGKYGAALQTLGELETDALHKQDILRTDSRPVDSIQIVREAIRIETAITSKQLEYAVQLKNNLEKQKFPVDAPVIFLPTDLYEQIAEHIRIKRIRLNDNTVAYKAMTLDSFLYDENESSAGSPREAVERLQRVIPILKTDSGTGVAQAGTFFEKIVDMINHEFLSNTAPQKHWQEYDTVIKDIMANWCAAKNRKDTVDTKAIELKSQLLQAYEKAQRQSDAPHVDASTLASAG